MNQRISIHVCTRDRHSEIACLLVSLRNQTYKEWDLVIVDESETDLMTHVPTVYLLNRIRQERHKVNFMRNTVRQGVCHARNICVDNDHFDNPLTMRVDDDVVLDSEYIEKLVRVIDQGYSLASGVTPLMQHPELIRDPKRLNGIVNVLEWDADGNITKYGDDCGMCYDISYGDCDENTKTKEITPAYILPAHHFRSCALYKSEVHDKDVRYESNLSPVGFREETFFSLRLRYLGYTMAVDLTAKAWHFQTPSGGCRFPNYNDLVRQDEESFRKWSKKMFEKNGGTPQ